MQNNLERLNAVIKKGPLFASQVVEERIASSQ